MPDLKLDPTTGDLAIVNGDLALTNDAAGETVAQRLRIRLRLFKGEWFLDTRLGVPFLSEVLVKVPNLARIEALLREAIAGTPGVGSIKAYSQTLDRANRKLDVAFSVVTADGVPLTLNEVIG